MSNLIFIKHHCLPNKAFQKTGGGNLVFISAKAAYNSNTAVNNLAYSLSKQMLFNFTAIINECEEEYNTKAHILLSGTLVIKQNRNQMPDAGFSEWILTEMIANTIEQIIQGQETRTVIHL